MQGEDRGVNDSIYIYKIKKGKTGLFKCFPLETVADYKDGKWDFIKCYRSKNYKQFGKCKPNRLDD